MARSTTAFAEDAAGPLEGEEAERGEADNEADGKADALVGKGEVDGVMGRGGIEQQGDDSEKGCEKEGGHAGRDAHEERLKPAEIA